MSTISRRRLFTGPIMGAAAALGIVGLTASPPAAQIRLAQSATVEVFGIIRLLPGGPEVLDDAGHTPQGVTGVSIHSSGMLEIQHDDLGDVGTSSVTVDETLVGRGIMIGQSQGFTWARVRFYDSYYTKVLDLNDPADYNRVVDSTANVWFRAASS